MPMIRYWIKRVLMAFVALGMTAPMQAGWAAGKRKAQPQGQVVEASVDTADFAFDDAFWYQNGTASWYGGRRWHGGPTASGERFNEHELTAAHAFLPMGSRVVVTLEGSDRQVVVTINDRIGTRSRVIDLSKAAAAALGILNSGIAPVTLTLATGS